MKIKTMIAALLLVAAVGCRKDGESITANPGVEKAKSEITAVTIDKEFSSPENLKNPFDDSGVKHNRILKAIDDQVQLSHDDSFEAKRSFGIAYCKKFEHCDVSKSIIIVDRGARLVNEVGIQKAIGGSLNERTGKYAQRMIDHAQLMKSLNAYEDYLVQVKSLEDEIINDDLLSDNDRKGLLISASVARYTGYYWTKRFDKIPNSYPNDGKSFWNQLLQLHAGVNGDIVGTIFGMFTDDSVEDVIETAATFSGGFAGWVRNHW